MRYALACRRQAEQVVVHSWESILLRWSQDELRIQNTQCDNCLIGCMVASQARTQADRDMRSCSLFGNRSASAPCDAAHALARLPCSKHLCVAMLCVPNSTQSDWTVLYL